MISSDFSKYEFHKVEDKVVGGMVFDTRPHSRLNSYMIPMGLFVDKSDIFKHHGGGSGSGEEEDDEIVEMKGGGSGGEDWLSSERFDRLFAMASPSKQTIGATKGGNQKNRKNLTKKRRPHTTSSSSSWKLW
jgi:hypothetical protein